MSTKQFLLCAIYVNFLAGLIAGIGLTALIGGIL